MAKYTIEQLQNALINADKAGDTAAARLLVSQIKSMQSAQEPQESSGSGFVEGVKNLGLGLKAGFDKPAYALAQLTPDVPIPQEYRQGWNDNLLVKSLGLTIPDSQDRQSQLAAGDQLADKSKLAAVGQIAGEVAPAVFGGTATAGTNLMRAAATQAGLGYATTPGDVPTRAMSAALAATGEGVGRGAAQAASRVFQPIRPNAAAQRLIDQGNLPTPGAAIGPASKKIEESAASLPGAGAFINRAFLDGMSDANRIAMEQGGLKVPGPGMVGQKDLGRQFKNLFDDALANVSFDIQDEAFEKGIQNIMRKSNLDAKGIRYLRNFINERAGNLGIGKAQPEELKQLLSGKDLQLLLEEVGEQQANFSKATGYEGQLGPAFGKVKDLIEDLLEQQPQNAPEAVKALQDVRRSYALTVPAIKAGETSAALRRQAAEAGKSSSEVNRAAPPGGIFTPAGYSNSLTNNAKSRGRIKALREGDDPLLPFASDFETVYGNRYQDSGTATRAALTGLALGLGGAFSGEEDGYGPLYSSLGSLGALAGIGAAAYSPTGRRLLLGQLRGQKITADALRKMAPGAGTVGAAFLPSSALPYANEEQ